MISQEMLNKQKETLAELQRRINTHQQALQDASSRLLNYAHTAAEGLTGVRHGSACWLDLGNGAGHTPVIINWVRLVINGLTVAQPASPSYILVSFTIGAEAIGHQCRFDTALWLGPALPPIVTAEKMLGEHKILSEK